MKIIIVEEDVELGMSLKTELQKQGFTVDLLTDGEESSTRLKMHHSNYDLAILGLNLPGKPGHEICAELRTLQIGLPIMMLVESGMNESKIAAFDVGADDCVAKPISIRELIARARALLCRLRILIPRKLRVKDLELCVESHTVVRDGETIHLTLKEFNILEHLMRSPNQVVIRDTLLDKIWDFNFRGFSNVIDVHINNLRKKLKICSKRNCPVHKELIQTVRGVGYKITA